MRRMQPSETTAGAGGSVGPSCPCRKGKASGSNSLPPRPRIQPLASPRYTSRKSASRRDQAPRRSSIVSGCCLVVQQARVEGADAIAFIERPGLGIGARWNQVAVLGIEQEDEAQENRQEAFIEVFRPA